MLRDEIRSKCQKRRPIWAIPAAGMALTILVSGAALAAVCTSPSETAAVQVRILQSELMVAALSCRAKPKYNKFVKQFEPVLVRSGKTLVAMFHRDHPGRAVAELNRFITRLANGASAHSINFGASYCVMAYALYDTVLSLRPSELVEFSAQHAQAGLPYVPATCGVQTARQR